MGSCLTWQNQFFSLHLSGLDNIRTCYATTVATLAASSILCTQSCWVCSSCCSQACVMGAVRVFRGVLPACFKVGRAATVRVQIRVEQGPTLSAAGAYLWHCFTLLCALYMAVPCCMWSTARLIKASCMVAVRVQIFPTSEISGCEWTPTEISSTVSAVDAWFIFHENLYSEM